MALRVVLPLIFYVVGRGFLSHLEMRCLSSHLHNHLFLFVWLKNSISFSSRCVTNSNTGFPKWSGRSKSISYCNGHLVGDLGPWFYCLIEFDWESNLESWNEDTTHGTSSVFQLSFPLVDFILKLRSS